jgi:CubicO group peptidase (beta-lactamase class C family)
MAAFRRIDAHPSRQARLFRALTGVALAFVLAAPHAARAQQGPLKGLDAYVENAMKAWEVPGLALVVVKGDSVIYAKGYGVADLATGAPVDQNTLFAIASTSKAFTVAALGMLVDEGKLSWDDRVIDHLPGFEVEDPYVTAHLTVRDLLTHRAGVAREDNMWVIAKFKRDEIVQRARYLAQVDEFRAKYGYNNIMFTTAGEVAGRVSGIGWDDFVAQRIFQPLGMTRSTTRSAVVDTRGNVSSSHTRVDGKVQSVPRRNYDNIGGAGAIFSSAHDMGQWLRLQLGHGVYAGTRLLSDSVIAEMRQPQNPLRVSTDTAQQRLFPDVKFRAYGFAWNVQDWHNRVLVHHSGSINYTRTHVGFIPEAGIGFAAMANLTSSGLQEALMYKVFDMLLGNPAVDWSAEMLAQTRRGNERSGRSVQELDSARIQGTTPSVALDAYAGTYLNDLYGEVQVTVEGGKLVLSYSPEYIGDLEHWHHDTFRAVWRPVGAGRSFVRFSLDERARITALELDGFGAFTKKVERPNR